MVEVEPNHLDLISDDRDPEPLVAQLWKAAKAPTGEGDSAERRDPPLRIREGWGAFKIASAMSADSASSFGDHHLKGASVHGAVTARGSGELRKVSGNSESVRHIMQFADSGDTLNPLRNCDWSLRSTVSGIRYWGLFFATQLYELAPRLRRWRLQGGRAFQPQFTLAQLSLRSQFTLEKPVRTWV